MQQIKAIIQNNEGYEVTFAYLIDEENALFFYNQCVWLARVQKTENDLFEVITPMSLLGEQKPVNDLQQYAEFLVNKLKKTSLFDYIVQKHFYDDQDINFDIAGV